MSTVYQCNIYVSQYDEEVFDYSFVCIARDKAELVKKVKEVLRRRLGCTQITMDEVINYFEHFYAHFEHFYTLNTIPTYVSITATTFFDDINEENLKKSLKEIREMSDNGIDILHKLRELMIGYQYDIKYLRNGVSIEKSDILYNGPADTDIVFSIREDSDYHKHGKNKFVEGDFVKVKYLENSPVFTVGECPEPKCTYIGWENVYGIIAECEYGMIFSTVHENDIVHCTMSGRIL